MRYPLKGWNKIKRGSRFGGKTFYSPNHLGTDYLVPVGTPVLAPKDCEILVAAIFSQGGNTVHVKLESKKYGTVVMRCMHLSKMSPPGKYKAGAVLGLTGDTGELCDGPHLHLDLSRGKVMIRNFKNFIDPEKFFASKTRRGNKKLIIYKNHKQ